MADANSDIEGPQTEKRSVPSSRRGQSTRDRPAKPPLSEDAIVEAALEIVRSEGLDALTMRKVAAALDTAAGSLYVYVDGRDGLLRAAFDRVVATVSLEAPDPAGWRSQLESLLERVRRALIGYPGMAAAAMIDPPRTPAVLRLLENLLSILMASGLDGQRAVWTADILSAHVTYAAIESELRRVDPDTMAKELSADFARLPAAQFPVITAHAAELVTGDLETRFRFAINTIVDGALHRQSLPASGG